MKRTIKRVGMLLAVALLVVVAVGAAAADTGEIAVTADVDGTPFRTLAKAAAADAAGNAVIAWVQSPGSYPYENKVYARHYDSSGTAGAPIAVVSLPGSRVAGYVDVAMNDSGAFVVAWTQAFTDADNYSVHAALYDSSAALVRGPFQGNTIESRAQWKPSVAIDDDGDFIVAWQEGPSAITPPDTIYARFYDSTGDAAGGEFVVNTTTDGYRNEVDVSMAGDGRAVAVWHAEANAVQDEAVYAQLFNADRTRNGAVKQLSTPDIATNYPAVAMDDGGGFVAAWQVSSGTVLARQFDAKGAAVTDELFVDTDSTANEIWPDIAGDGAGNFAVVWQSDGRDGVGGGIYARLYDGEANPQGDAFQVNVVTADDEEFPVVAMSDSGHAFFVWGRWDVSALRMDGVYTRFLSTGLGNTSPTANAGGPYSGVEGSRVQLDGSGSSDPDGNALSYSWSVNASLCTFEDPTAASPYLICDDNGSYEVTLEVGDGQAADSDTATVSVENVAPTASFGNDGPVAEGSAFSLSLSSVRDPSNVDMQKPFTYAFDCDDGSGYTAFSESSSATCPTTDDGTRDVRGKVRDKDGGTSEYSAVATVDNVAPTIDAIAGPAEPVALGAQPVEVSVAFSDPGTGDTHTTTVDWGDGSSDAYGEASPAAATHTYAEAGVYTLNVTVTDDDGAGDGEVYEYIVVFDENSSVNGHGAIDAAPAWCLSQAICGGASGVARFGFTAQYRRGAGTPSGRTVFGFRTHDFEFVSDSYEQLIVNQAGTNGQFKGSGLINGAVAKTGAPYKFMIWATDGSPDMFRIKIWFEENGAETVVYDNGQERAIDRGQIIVSNR